MPLNVVRIFVVINLKLFSLFLRIKEFLTFSLYSAFNLLQFLHLWYYYIFLGVVIIINHRTAKMIFVSYFPWYWSRNFNIPWPLDSSANTLWSLFLFFFLLKMFLIHIIISTQILHFIIYIHCPYHTQTIL